MREENKWESISLVVRTSTILRLGGGNKPPSSPGEYRIRDNSGQMCYIGETCNLNRRTSEHRRTGKLAEGSTFEYKVADGRSTSATQREHERSKITQHNPLLNRSSGGEGRIEARKKT